MRTRSLPLLASLAAGLVLAACGSSTGDPAGSDVAASTSSSSGGTATPSEGATPAAGDAMAAGAYLTKAEYQDQMAAREGTAVVYFFHAPWCPDCRATEEAIE